jgi:hypothetical protein
MNACAWIGDPRHIPRQEKETSHEPAFFNMVVVLSFLVVAADGPSLLRARALLETIRHASARLRSSLSCLLLSFVSNLNPCQPRTPDFAPSVGASVTPDTRTPQLKAAWGPLRSEPMRFALFHRSVGRGLHSYPLHKFRDEDGFCATPLA